jgi:hypothetical protein
VRRGFIVERLGNTDTRRTRALLRTGNHHLSHCFLGAGERNRTSDLLITNPRAIVSRMFFGLLCSSYQWLSFAKPRKHAPFHTGFFCLFPCTITQELHRLRAQRPPPESPGTRGLDGGACPLFGPLWPALGPGGYKHPIAVPARDRRPPIRCSGLGMERP